jgi:hypothetical protein
METHDIFFFKVVSNSFHSPVTSSLLGQDILLFTDTLNLYSSLRVRDQVSYPYKAESETGVLFILIFRFF